jgi:hypothetical protein
MMKNLQKMGGIAALYAAAAYVVGMVGFLLVVDVSSAVDPIQKVALMAENQIFLSILHLIVYVVWAVFLVVLSLALHDRLKADSPAMMQTATVFGLIWACIIIASGMIYNIGMETVVDLYGTDPAQAATVWMAIESVFDGIGGGTEIVGTLWVLLLSWVALRGRGLPKALNYLGVAISVPGLLSVFPGLGSLGFFFGLGQIVWFVWLGIVMLRGRTSAAA